LNHEQIIIQKDLRRAPRSFRERLFSYFLNFDLVAREKIGGIGGDG